jgi:ectoine hydroxylase-related dioxygenase (phytanoyl-CoA dioxygenase family)
MDSVLLWLPWWENASWRPFTEGLHIDQNPFFKEEKICVQVRPISSHFLALIHKSLPCMPLMTPHQGMIPLIDVDEESGGLEVVPGSHLSPSREQFKARHSKYQTRPADWLVCPGGEVKMPTSSTTTACH